MSFRQKNDVFFDIAIDKIMFHDHIFGSTCSKINQHAPKRCSKWQIMQKCHIFYFKDLKMSYGQNNSFF